MEYSFNRRAMAKVFSDRSRPESRKGLYGVQVPTCSHFLNLESYPTPELISDLVGCVLDREAQCNDPRPMDDSGPQVLADSNVLI